MEETIYRFTPDDIRQSRKLVREIFAKVISERSHIKTSFDFIPKQTSQRIDKTKIPTNK